MRQGGPNQGIFIAADPATVERLGKCHRPGMLDLRNDNGVISQFRNPDRSSH